MGIVLGPNRYGKAESRVVRIYRDTARHEIRDLNVSTMLRGDFTDAHVTGDQAHVLPTDTQKNTAFAYAKEHGVTSPEDYALALGRRLLTACGPAEEAWVRVEEQAWERISVDGHGHDHAFVRSGTELRTTEVVVGETTTVTSGLTDLVLLKSTASEYAGFLRDEYTTLPDADDRILATSLTAAWRHVDAGGGEWAGRDWDASYDAVRAVLVETFATTYSLAMQHTLHAMGRAALEAHDELAEVSLSAPNKHHHLVDLTPFGLENPGEVFIAADRPYGLIEASVVREADA
jgi:urate oxidase